MALADAPPRIGRKLIADPKAAYRARRRTLTIRHASGHRIVAFLEILSPGNKDRTTSVQEFVNKVDSALMQGIHVMIVELFPPAVRSAGPSGGGLGPIRHRGVRRPSRPALDRLLVPGRRARRGLYRAHGVRRPLARHAPVPGGRYLCLSPLELTYQAAFQDMPAFLRDPLEGRRLCRRRCPPNPAHQDSFHFGAPAEVRAPAKPANSSGRTGSRFTLLGLVLLARPRASDVVHTGT